MDDSEEGQRCGLPKAVQTHSNELPVCMLNPLTLDGRFWPYWWKDRPGLPKERDLGFSDHFPVVMRLSVAMASDEGAGPEV